MATISDDLAAKLIQLFNQTTIDIANQDALLQGSGDVQITLGSNIKKTVASWAKMQAATVGSASLTAANTFTNANAFKSITATDLDVTTSKTLTLKETSATNGVGVNFVSNNAVEASFGIENTNGGTAVFHNYAKGSGGKASPDGQLIGGYGSRPWTGSAYTAHSNVSLHFLQHGACSTANHGGWFRILVTPNGKTMDNRLQAFAVSSNGDTFVGKDVPMGAKNMADLNVAMNELDGRGFKQVVNTANELALVTPRSGQTASMVLRGMSCNGTLSSPGASQTGDNLWLGIAGHDGSVWRPVAAGVRCQVVDGWGSTSRPADITLATTPIGSTTRVDRWNIAHNGHLIPCSDATTNIGTGGLRVNTIYASNGSINTSDARLKTSVREMTADEIAAASDLAKEIGFFRWLEKVNTEDSPREHCGLTVQRAIEIMEAHGLQPFNYAFICYDEWENGDIYGFRYEQLNMFIARGLEARISRLEKLL